MKSILMLVIIGLATTQAQAIGNLSFDVRTDMLSQTYNSAAELATPGLSDNYRFLMQTARLDYKGVLNDSVSYRARFRLAGKNQTAVEVRDNTNATLDFAYATHKMSDMFKLTVGKFATDVGGYEGATAGPDLYMTSESYGGTGANTPLGGGTGLRGYVNMLFATGVKLAVTMDTHELSVMALDLDANVDRGGANATAPGLSTQNRNMFGVVYRGTILDKLLGLSASYHTQTPRTDFKNEWLNVGLQWNSNPILAQLDYSVNSSNYLSGTTGYKDKLSSIVGKVVYSFDENLGLGIKVASSEEMLDQAAPVNNKYMSYGLQAEYKPVATDIYRYHVALNSRDETPELGDKRNLQEVVVGMRILGDFLK